MTQTFFEATKSQKKLADIGRAMMDYSEDYGKLNGLARVTDEGLRTLNNLSQTGYMLTQVGAAFGTSYKDFTDEQLKLITDFGNKKVDIERK